MEERRIPFLSKNTRIYLDPVLRLNGCRDENKSRHLSSEDRIAAAAFYTAAAIEQGYYGCTRIIDKRLSSEK
jgi:hypothetical protein